MTVLVPSAVGWGFDFEFPMSSNEQIGTRVTLDEGMHAVENQPLPASSSEADINAELRVPWRDRFKLSL